MHLVPIAMALSILGGHAAPPPDQLDVANALRLAFGLPRTVAASVYLSRTMVVEAVYQATALSGGGLVGRVVNTGTLAPGYGGAYQYSPQPTDRLVVHYAGQVHEFVVHEAQGNPQAMTSDAWVLSPHQLRYRHRMGTEAEADVAVLYDGSSFDISVRGWTTQWGQRYEVDLRAVGRQAGVRDYGGQDIQTAYDVTGTIRGQGLELTVNERHESSLVAATSPRLLPSQRGTASQSNSTLNNDLSLGGAVYQLRDVQIQSGSQGRAGQGSAGMTGVTGSVLRDGEPYGRFVYQAGRAVLETSDGSISMDGGPGIP